MKTKSLFLGAIVFACFNSISYASKLSGINPDISLTLDGRYGSYSNAGDYELPGFMLGSEASRGEKGFYLGHNELSISANIDDMFYGKFTTAITEHEAKTEVELEEAYIETPALGYGVTVKAGRFYSDVGYLNNQHGHAWDFADAPLIYRGLFANQLLDDGLQVSWLAPTDIYFKLGIESTRGERFPAGGAANDGRGANAVFAEFGGDVGVSHAWQLGFSHWRADVVGRTAGAHAHGTTSEIPTFTGDSRISGIDFVWKWAPNGNKHERNLKIQAEYFVRDENGRVDMAGSSPLETSTYEGEQSGWYLQTVYQFKPRWRIGYRYDRLRADNTGSDPSVLTEASLDDKDHTPERSTLMLDYSHSEYSRIRMQYARDKSYTDSDNLFFLQYIVTLGAHSAHRF
ncbi:MAG: porin [Gammaproteobacteria bacterium]|nr:porin [Gammaproteobacteria bacterium]